jgi:YrbI family 3-deoxy-D-manno-octulosonate 8-phosphate phosphatase
MSDPGGEPIELQVPGLTLRGLAWGDPEAPPLLALHGWLDNAASWAPIAPHLPGRRLVALDLPGHGLSDHKPVGVAYHFVDWVVDVVAAADALGWERFDLLGHSMGAGIASLVAGTAPDRVAHLVLIEGIGPLAVSAEEAPLRLAKSIARREGRARRKPRAHPDVAAAAERLCQANPGLTPETARILSERGTRPVEGGVTWRSDPRLRGSSPMRITEDHVHAFLKRIASPALVLKGREGYAFDQKVIAARVACVEGAEVRELPGGHHLHMDDPEGVAAVLEPFFARPSAASGAGDEPLASPGVTLDDLRTLAAVKLVVLDVDGVLTTGQLPWSEGGNQHLVFDVKDGLGIKLLSRAGIGVALLSGRAPEATRARAAHLGIPHVMLGIKHKLPRLEELLAQEGLELRDVAYMGDDLPDLSVLKAVGYPVAPADAVAEVREVAKFVTSRPGGRGAVRELAEHLLKAQGRWASLLTGF